MNMKEKHTHHAHENTYMGRHRQIGFTTLHPSHALVGKGTWSPEVKT
jgi:hypothetical protein